MSPADSGALITAAAAGGIVRIFANDDDREISRVESVKYHGL